MQIYMYSTYVYNFPGPVNIHHVRTPYYVVLVSLSPHEFSSPRSRYYNYLKTKNYGVMLAFGGIIYIPIFVKLGPQGHELIWVDS